MCEGRTHTVLRVAHEQVQDMSDECEMIPSAVTGGQQPG